MFRSYVTIVYVLSVLVLSTQPVTRADEASIQANIRSFFRTDDPARRAQLAETIQADAVFDRARVREWLQQANLFAAYEAGRRHLRVPVSNGSSCDVRLRIPAGYDHQRPYPLLYCLHGMGGNGDGIIAYIEHVLGPEIDEYLVAAPSGYEQVIIQSTTPPSNEHPAILNAVRATVHVDANRVFALGYSRGGHTAWTLAVLHPDQFAGVVAVAGTLILQDYGKLFETFLPNISNTHVFACWGENDTMSADYVTRSADGGIAGLNVELCKLAARLRLPLTWYQHPDKGHSDIEPPRTDLDRILAVKRQSYPPKIGRVFRLPYQGSLAWIEAHAWRGPWWDEKPLKITFRRDENPNDMDVQAEAAARAVRSRLGELRGEVDGQQIQVYRKKITELTVWIGDDMIDWEQPITLTVNGGKAFEGKLEPDLLVCLTQAARTYDFERLRWAGLRVKSGSRTRVVTGETPFPPPPITPQP